MAKDRPPFGRRRAAGPGRPTRWRRRLKTRFRLTWTLQEAQIAADAQGDGLFPLLTNDPTLTAGQLLDAYKTKQPLVEKRHDLLKNVEAATPVYLKSISRIEALLFLHFVALLVHALIERDVRAAMVTGALPELPLYPEDRACKAPSAARILEIFSPLQRHLLGKTDRVIQRFDPDLTPLQRRLLSCLGVSPAAFLTV